MPCVRDNGEHCKRVARGVCVQKVQDVIYNTCDAPRTFSPGIGNETCLDCWPSSGTNGAEGQTGCLYKPGHILPAAQAPALAAGTYAIWHTKPVKQASFLLRSP